MTLLPEVREEIVAAAQQGAHARGRRAPGALTAVLGVGCAAAVALIMLVALHGHPGPARPSASAGSSAAALEAKLAVLRRPQTAADRTLPLEFMQGGKIDPLIPSLTRLAGTTAVGGQTVRLYVFVRRLHRLPTRVSYTGPLAGPGDAVGAIAVDARGRLLGGTGIWTVSNLRNPAHAMSAAWPAVNRMPVAISIVPDGVTRVKWVFTGAGFGILHPRPVTVYPRLLANVAVAPASSTPGPLASVAWYGAHGNLIASGSSGAYSSSELRTIKAVNASRTVPIASVLVAHYSLFRTVAPVSIRDLPAVAQSPGGYDRSLELNYWQIRYLPSLRGLDGRGLWIIPGAHGLCIDDPNSGECGPVVSTHTRAGILGATTGGGGHESLTGLVPDGNPTVTLVLANGSRQTVPVIHNVYEATVRGRVVAIIDRDITGRLVRTRM